VGGVVTNHVSKRNGCVKVTQRASAVVVRVRQRAGQAAISTSATLAVEQVAYLVCGSGCVWLCRCGK
jgi:hypothetical protein